MAEQTAVLEPQVPMFPFVGLFTVSAAHVVGGGVVV
jgi:hypothetical protein